MPAAYRLGRLPFYFSCQHATVTGNCGGVGTGCSEFSCEPAKARKVPPTGRATAVAIWGYLDRYWGSFHIGGDLLAV